ncbi:MAG: hypothetical protein ACLTSX_11575 [Collinsella sp.]
MRRRAGSSSSSWWWARPRSASPSSNEGDFIRDITGPLGQPTEVEGDSVAVIGGGVGLAIAYPVARMLCEQGKNVYVIMGARTKDLLSPARAVRRAAARRPLFVTTDDGSMGEKGVVTLPLARLCETDSIDHAFCVGPVPMMKFSSLTCHEHNIPIIASLNPIMVDGTRHVRRCCRVEVGGETKFACVRRPRFRRQRRRLGRPGRAPGQLPRRRGRFHQAS